MTTPITALRYHAQPEASTRPAASSSAQFQHYVRLNWHHLAACDWHHLMSAFDDLGSLSAVGHGHLSTTAWSGYTEWTAEFVVSTFDSQLNAKPQTLSLGWDWVVDPIVKRAQLYRRTGYPRSNIMLQAQGQDLGQLQTESALLTLIDGLSWQTALQEALQVQYS